MSGTQQLAWRIDASVAATQERELAGQRAASIAQFKAVTKRHKLGQRVIEVLYDVNLSIARGEFLALMGPSGSGKTTVLNLLGGFDVPDQGEVNVAGRRLDQCSQRALARWRVTNVGFVFQFYHLLPMLTAERNAMLPLLLAPLSRAERRRRVHAVFDMLGITACAQRRPEELSGGQQQRVAIARAIVADPELLICDEPTGDLDRAGADNVLDVLQQLNQQLGKTIVMATHDPVAAQRATRILQLRKGRQVGELS